MQVHRDDVEFECVAVTTRIVPVHQLVDTGVHHRHRVAQILPTILAACEIRKVRRAARVGRRGVVLIEARRADTENTLVRHADQLPQYLR